MIVLDASAALTLLLNLAPARTLRARLREPGETLHVPHLFDIEVLHVLRRHANAGRLAPARADAAVRGLTELRLTRYPHVPFQNRIWRLRENLSAYDAAYVVLAEALDAPLLTSDARLARTPGHRALVELVE